MERKSKITRIAVFGILAVFALTGTGFPAALDEVDEASGGATQANPAPEQAGSSVLAAAAQENPDPQETENIDMLAGMHKFMSAGNRKDPFDPIIKKKLPTIEPLPVNPPIVKPPEPVKPPLPPLKLSVKGIVGSEEHRLALIMFENRELVVQPDQTVDGKFKVVTISPKEVIVYSNRDQMRRAFPIESN